LKNSPNTSTAIPCAANAIDSPCTEIPLHLETGELVGRPNRFVFEGIVNGKIQRLHCPVTGKIGIGGDFNGIPFLFTPASDMKNRSTCGTVEALSINGGKDWIGINQNRINGWMESLLKQNALPLMIDSNGCTVRHEIQVDDSRIDIVVEGEKGKTFLELKTPMRDLLLQPNDRFTRPPSQSYFDRGLKHFKTLAKLAQSGHRTMVAMCFMYDAPLFLSPVRDKWNAKIIDTIAEANEAGVENWQINLRINRHSLRVTLCRSRSYIYSKENQEIAYRE
jgi:sugar fermentation stimulation protein A